jgi:hypothetical protein
VSLRAGAATELFISSEVPSIHGCGLARKTVSPFGGVAHFEPAPDRPSEEVC